MSMIKYIKDFLEFNVSILRFILRGHYITEPIEKGEVVTTKKG